jgi:hypothetical protein
MVPFKRLTPFQGKASAYILLIQDTRYVESHNMQLIIHATPYQLTFMISLQATVAENTRRPLICRLLSRSPTTNSFHGVFRDAHPSLRGGYHRRKIPYHPNCIDRRQHPISRLARGQLRLGAMRHLAHIGRLATILSSLYLRRRYRL